MDDPSENVTRLGKAARAIVAKLPPSTIVNVVAVRWALARHARGFSGRNHA